MEEGTPTPYKRVGWKNRARRCVWPVSLLTSLPSWKVAALPPLCNVIVGCPVCMMSGEGGHASTALAFVEPSLLVDSGGGRIQSRLVSFTVLHQAGSA